MDTLLGQILICNVGIRRELSRLEREKTMTPKLNGLGALLGKLKHDFETEGAPLVTELQALGADGLAAIKEAKAHVSVAKSFIQDIKDFNVSMQEEGNGGPPLAGSAGSSSSSTAAESLRHD